MEFLTINLDVYLDICGSDVDYLLICTNDEADLKTFRKNYKNWTQLEKMLLTGTLFYGNWSQVRLAVQHNGEIYLFIIDY